MAACSPKQYSPCAPQFLMSPRMRPMSSRNSSTRRRPPLRSHISFHLIPISFPASWSKPRQRASPLLRAQQCPTSIHKGPVDQQFSWSMPPIGRGALPECCNRSPNCLSTPLSLSSRTMMDLRSVSPSPGPERSALSRDHKELTWSFPFFGRCLPVGARSRPWSLPRTSVPVSWISSVVLWLDPIAIWTSALMLRPFGRLSKNTVLILPS